MKKIRLSNGKYALVDDENSVELKKHKWFVTKDGYVARWGSWKNGPGVALMHREILKLSPGSLYVDHINRKPLDNRKNNLRLCSNSQNQMNSKLHIKNTSGYRGVTWNKKGKRWRAQIKFRGKRIFLGDFVEKAEAVKAYIRKAKHLFGDYFIAPSAVRSVAKVN